MKKHITILLITSIFWMSNALAAGYKVCYFHDIEYAYIPEYNQCPWNTSNLPPDVDEVGPNDTVITISPNKKRIIHSPECFDEQNGGMN